MCRVPSQLKKVWKNWKITIRTAVLILEAKVMELVLATAYQTLGSTKKNF
jgi:hypothetical protein